MLLDRESFKRELSKRREAKRYRNHAWYKTFFKRQMTHEQVKFWHLQHYFLVSSTHDLLGGLYMKCHIPQLRVKLLEAMQEEELGNESGTAAHAELAARVAMALGATKEELKNVVPLPETLAYRRSAEWMIQNGTFLDGIAGVALAGEGQQPDVGDEVAQVLQEKYGLTRDQAAWWWVHGKADEDHSKNALEGVAALCPTEADQQRALRALEEGLDSQYLYLSGLHRVLVEDRQLN